VRRSEAPQVKGLETSITHAPSTTETTMQGGYSPPCRPRDTRHLTMEKVPPGRLPKGELLCVGRNLGLCVLALCFAFVALR
jgi:hypothetical protein